jgi:hypothetical protein
MKISIKENWIRLIKNDDPQWICPPWEPFIGNAANKKTLTDPITLSITANAVHGTEYKDAWGVTYRWLGDNPPHPHITDENKVIKDITAWEDFVSFPELDGHDWSESIEFIKTVDRDEYFLMCNISGGLFERSHFLMGFEDALVNYMVEPEAMTALLSAIADWKIGQLTRIIDILNPDVILFHDDWGNKSNLFMHPDVWRTIIKPLQAKIVNTIKSAGKIMIHHADCICEPIVEDMAEIGIDIWQGVIPQNNIKKIQKDLNGRMAMMGGIDAPVIEHPNPNEEKIRAEVRRCIDEYCPQGHFIPCIPNIFPLFDEVQLYYEDEIIKYGKDFFKK